MIWRRDDVTCESGWVCDRGGVRQKNKSKGPKNQMQSQGRKLAAVKTAARCIGGRSVADRATQKGTEGAPKRLFELVAEGGGRGREAKQKSLENRGEEVTLPRTCRCAGPLRRVGLRRLRGREVRLSGGRRAVPLWFLKVETAFAVTLRGSGGTGAGRTGGGVKNPRDAGRAHLAQEFGKRRADSLMRLLTWPTNWRVST